MDLIRHGLTPGKTPAANRPSSNQLFGRLRLRDQKRPPRDSRRSHISLSGCCNLHLGLQLQSHQPQQEKFMPTSVETVNLADARRIIAAAEKKAAEIGQPMNIAVADAGGNLVAHVRMDGAWVGSVDISIKKA